MTLNKVFFPTFFSPKIKVHIDLKQSSFPKFKEGSFLPKFKFHLLTSFFLFVVKVDVEYR